MLKPTQPRTFSSIPSSADMIDGTFVVGDRYISGNTIQQWNGTAWETIPVSTFTVVYVGYGPAGSIPAAASVPDGSLYFDTDNAHGFQNQIVASTPTWVQLF